MRAVYSSVFAAIAGLDTTYEVAPDFDNLRVLRCFDAYWGGGLSASPSIRLIGHAGQTIYEGHVLPTSVAAALDSAIFQWRGRQVIPAGGVVLITVDGPPADVTLSGYTLRA